MDAPGGAAPPRVAVGIDPSRAALQIATLASSGERARGASGAAGPSRRGAVGGGAGGRAGGHRDGGLALHRPVVPLEAAGPAARRAGGAHARIEALRGGPDGGPHRRQGRRRAPLLTAQHTPPGYCGMLKYEEFNEVDEQTEDAWAKVEANQLGAKAWALVGKSRPHTRSRSRSTYAGWRPQGVASTSWRPPAGAARPGGVRCPRAGSPPRAGE